MVHYKGDTGLVRRDEVEGILRGMVVTMRDLVTSRGKTYEEIERAFHDSLEDYLVFCKELGRQPESPGSPEN